MSIKDTNSHRSLANGFLRRNKFELVKYKKSSGIEYFVYQNADCKVLLWDNARSYGESELVVALGPLSAPNCVHHRHISHTVYEDDKNGRHIYWYHLIGEFCRKEYAQLKLRYKQLGKKFPDFYEDEIYEVINELFEDNYPRAKDEMYKLFHEDEALYFADRPMRRFFHRIFRI